MNAQAEVIDAIQGDTIKTSIGKVQGEIAAFDKIAAGIAAIEKAHPKDLAIDVTSTAGMKLAVTARAAWRDPRIAVEKARKAAKAPVLELGKQIDSFAGSLEARLREGEANYDEQIKAEETRKEAERAARAEAERLRISRHHAVIQYLRGIPADVAGAPTAKIASEIAQLEALDITDSLEEFQGQAQLAKDETLDKLREMQADALDREAEQARVKAEQEAAAAALAAERAELERLRAEQAERERIAAAAQAEEQRKAREARQAEERAQAARIAAEREAHEAEMRVQREAQERELAAQRAAQAKADAEAAAKRKAEEDEIAARMKALADEREAVAAEQRRQAQAAEDARIAEFARQQKALKQIQQAAPAMGDALIQWRDAEASKDKTALANARIARDAAIAAAGL